MTRTSIDGVSAIEIVGNKRYRVADDALRRIPATIHLDLVENRPQPNNGYSASCSAATLLPVSSCTSAVVTSPISRSSSITARR